MNFQFDTNCDHFDSQFPLRSVVMRIFLLLLGSLSIAEASLKCQSFDETMPQAKSIDCAAGKVCVLSLTRKGASLSLRQACDTAILNDPCELKRSSLHGDTIHCVCSDMNCNTPGVFMAESVRGQSLLEHLMTIGVTFESATNSFELAVGSYATVAEPAVTKSGPDSITKSPTTAPSKVLSNRNYEEPQGDSASGLSALCSLFVIFPLIFS
ncbi:hypothetical protein PFISCL1PPCAC_12186 [Pristionchus fissidentatus]|uniref:Uncharacterized protein n=1 Tax=Pristionchus fissidentatus TaxID=1538716 RepID=A0AAV5VT00_9BILA|nr:hypothetical protein PFISCL1PPCAC_12186 [Pristionchus fissidentatus]